jgi:hypothetical protein
MRVFPAADGALRVQQSPCQRWARRCRVFRRGGESRSTWAAFGFDATAEIYRRQPQECSLALPTSPRQRHSAYGIILGNTISSTRLFSCTALPASCMHRVLSSCIVLGGAGLDQGRATQV